MTNGRKCGNCVFLVEDEGEPFYCAILDLYTVREKDDSGCKDWREREFEKAHRAIPQA